MQHPKATILIVEDDAAILRGLTDVLVFNGYAVEGDEDGDKGLTTALKQSWDLLLLDVMLPGVDGFTICRRVRAARPNQAVVMLTARGSEEDIVTGFRAGADDYISKPFSLRELMVRVEAVLRRSGRPVGDDSLEIEGIVFDGGTLEARCGDQVSEVTRKEMDIIVYMFRHQHRIVSKKELLTEVWHYADADIETRTVDIHMLKLRKKIAALSPGTELIRTIRGEGYRLEYTP